MKILAQLQYMDSFPTCMHATNVLCNVSGFRQLVITQDAGCPSQYT